MKRLKTVCSLIERTGVFADVGCDHGLVSKFVLDNNLADVVCATDISEGSLNKAKQLLSNYENVRFYLGDGVQPLIEQGVRVDTAVICGMGGQTIMKILSNDAVIPTLILGAQKNTDKLRRFLLGRGYEITNDVMVEDRGKFYDVIKAEYGKTDCLDEIQMAFGKFYDRKNPDMLTYLSWLEGRLITYKQTEANVKLGEQIREVMKWQR